MECSVRKFVNEECHKLVNGSFGETVTNYNDLDNSTKRIQQLVQILSNTTTRLSFDVIFS